jgi:hypothetical protein
MPRLKDTPYEEWPEEIKEKARETSRKHFQNNRESYRTSHLKKRHAIKLFLIELLGGRCSICGYNKHPAALDFDHIDPATKTASVAHYIVCKQWKKAEEEAKKCRLLCANCHRETTYSDWE